jgi:hypothetical protein
MKPRYLSILALGASSVASAAPAQPPPAAKVEIVAPDVEIRTTKVVEVPAPPRRHHAQLVEVSVEQSYQPRLRNEVSARTGFQASLGGTTPSGVKFLFAYDRRVSELVWLDFELNPSFAVGDVRGTCYDAAGRAFDCGGALVGNGQAIDVLGGVKLKPPGARRLVPYANAGGGVVAIFDRPQGDGGFAAVLRGGGGVDYFVTPHLSLGGELQLTGGPAVYSHTCNACTNGHDEIYRAFDLAFGAAVVM